MSLAHGKTNDCSRAGKGYPRQIRRIFGHNSYQTCILPTVEVPNQMALPALTRYRKDGSVFQSFRLGKE